MDITVWNLLFKASLLAVLSFSITFVGLLFVTATVDSNLDKKEFTGIALISLVIMIICLLLFGIKITN